MLNKIDNPLETCHLKFASEDNGEFEGYGSVFNSNDLSNDTIAKGAFAGALEKGPPKMFLNHQHMDIPVGDWLDAKEDDVGLVMVGKIDMNHRDGPSVYSAMKRKAMSGLSIGALRSTLEFTKKDNGGRLITKADLKEVSIVTFPMEENAQIYAVKSEIETIDSLKDAELYLRDSGAFSKSTAQVFVSRIRALIQSDSEIELKNEITRLQAQLQTQDATRSLVDFIHNL